VTTFATEEAKVVVVAALSFGMGELVILSELVEKVGVIFWWFKLLFDPEAAAFMVL
jgi:hypothetical protein